MEQINLEDKLQELKKAKENVATLLEEPNALVSFHGLTYWAGRVEALRTEIKNSL